jgi:hypothetical protein
MPSGTCPSTGPGSTRGCASGTRHTPRQPDCPPATLTAAEGPTTKSRQPDPSIPVTKPDATPCANGRNHDRKISRLSNATSSVDQDSDSSKEPLSVFAEATVTCGTNAESFAGASGQDRESRGARRSAKAVQGTTVENTPPENGQRTRVVGTRSPSTRSSHADPGLIVTSIRVGRPPMSAEPSTRARPIHDQALAAITVPSR